MAVWMSTFSILSSQFRYRLLETTGCFEGYT
jgi:hypothetical protein